MTSATAGGGDNTWARVLIRLLDRPLWSSLVLALVTLAALVQSAAVRTEVDLLAFIGPQTETARDIRDFERRFGPMTEDEVLFVTAPTLAREDRLEALEDLAIDLRLTEGVAEVLGLHSIPAPGGRTAWLHAPAMRALTAEERLSGLRAAHPLAAQVLSEDLDATLMVVVPQAGADRDALAAAIAAVPVSAELAVAPAGLAEVHRAIARELMHDLSVLTPAALLLCMLLTFAVFRSWRALVVCALPPLVGLVWFFGFLGLADVPLDPALGELPIVLIVLGFSNCMHVYHAALHGARQSPDRRGAARRAVVETIPAAALTTLTTIIAFLSLLLPGSPALSQMARAGAVGMALMFVAVVLVAPLAMQALGAPAAGARVPAGFRRLVPLACRTSRATRLLPLGAVVLLIALVGLQSQSRTGFSYGEYLPERAAVTEALTRMDASGLGSDRVFVVVEAAPQVAAANGIPAAQANARAAAMAIWHRDGDGADWLDPLVEADVLDRLAAADGTAHALPVQLPIIADDAPADAAMRDLARRLDAAGLGEVARIVGPSHAIVTEAPRAIADLRAGLYLTIVVITALVWLVWGSLRIALVALVANVIPILSVEAWLVLAGREITIMNLIALIVAFGIAVDDTLHLLNRLRLAPGPDIGRRVETALARAGPPMVATTAILLAGLLVTTLSALPGVALYGWLIALAVTVALLTDLLLLPGLLRWVLR